MFKDKLDELFGLEEKPVQKPVVEVHAQTSAPVEEVPENEFEPEAPVDEESVAAFEPDPFTKALTEMLESEGVDVKLEKRRKYDPTSGDIATHDWQSQRERLFSNEPYKFRCKRCLKWVEVNTDETINDALTRNDIDPNCGQVVVGEIMNS